MSDESKIGSIQDQEYFLRGQKLTDLMKGGDWTGAIALTLIGRPLREEERALFSACLIASIDHGMAPPSAQVTRTIASCGKPLADSVAGGLLTLGPRHGNACSAASIWLREQVQEGADIEQSIKSFLETGKRLPGFGHAEYERDPRAVLLLEMAQTHLAVHPHTDIALAVGDELTKQKGKPLYVNIDGAIGAILADLEWPSELADALFLIARTVGLSAHAMEESATAKTYRRKE